MNWKDASNLYWTGNRLSSIEIDGLDEALAFSYNADGVRNGKTYWDKNGIPTYHRYTVDGNRIISETVSGAENYTLYYLYGANGGIEGFIYNNTYYYFQKNIQGDIIRICNCLGETVVEYGYDVWGTVTSVTGDLASTIGQINPFRYRGYYYDTETGWYYLNARYYDPNVGRFLSPDTILGANGGLQGYNLFAYCNNNPVMFADPSGNLYLPNTKLEAAKVCPENIMSQIMNSGLDATTKKYGGEYKDGKYMVYMFNDLDTYVRRSFFGWIKSLSVKGTVAYYYFEMSNNQEKYKYYMNIWRGLNVASQVMDVSNGGGPFFDTPNFPTIAICLNLLSVVQMEVNNQRDKVWEKAQFYKSKPDEYELKFVIIKHYIAATEWWEEKLYA